MNDELLKTIKAEFLRLMSCQLENAPAADVDVLCAAQTLHKFLVDYGLDDSDCGRVEDALQMIGKTCFRWPSPARVIEALPKKYYNQSALPHIETDEQRKKRKENNIRLCRELKKAIKKIPDPVPGLHELSGGNKIKARQDAGKFLDDFKKTDTMPADQQRRQQQEAIEASRGKG